MLIDSHCHLDTAYFPAGAGDVISRAKANGVRGFVCIGVGETLETARQAVALSEGYLEIYAAVGVHPHDAKTLDAAVFDGLSRLADHPRVVAIGETGLDYHYDHSPREQQAHTFRRMIALAREKRKPLVIHTRDAAEDTLRILREEHAMDVGGVIHCFSENRAFADKALELGFDLSFSGIVTFKSARAIQEVAAWAPTDRILVETDSPYLAPVPLRGKACEPSFLVHTAAYVARLRGVAMDEFAEQTVQNTVSRFRLPPFAADEPKDCR